MSKRKRIALFRAGEAAISRVVGVRGVYLCPICSGEFQEAAAVSGELTLEHVPPRSVGGRGIALTCRVCNSTAGYTAESALSAREENRRFEEFMRGDRAAYEPHVGLSIGGAMVRVRVERNPDTGATQFKILGERNDPKVVEAVSDYMAALASDSDVSGERFQVNSGVTYDSRLARIAELKAAFLAAFAAFGYRYALSSALMPVREQIMKPRQRILDEPWIVGVDDEETQLILIVEDPVGLIVKMGSVAVILPWVNSPDGLSEKIRAKIGEKQGNQISGRPVQWPIGLELTLDASEQEPPIEFWRRGSH